MKGRTVRATWPSNVRTYAEQELSFCFVELSSRRTVSPALYMKFPLSEAAATFPTSLRSEVRPAELNCSALGQGTEIIPQHQKIIQQICRCRHLVYLFARQVNSQQISTLELDGFPHWHSTIQTFQRVVFDVRRAKVLKKEKSARGGRGILASNNRYQRLCIHSAATLTQSYRTCGM